MKLPHTFLCVLLLCIFSSFGETQDCEHAGSNILYVQKEAQKALENEDVQVIRFHIYKALDAISKTDKQLADCNCAHAVASLEEASILLKNATKSKILANTRILLEKTIPHLAEAIEAVRNHDQHKSSYGNDKLKINTIKTIQTDTVIHTLPNEKLLKERIDASLEKYKLSLDKVMNTVGCTEARAFAMGIYENCEQQLLRSNLSEGKKYYNLRTKEITGIALDSLEDCEMK